MEKPTPITLEQIEECISILETLNSDTNKIFEIPKDKRLALIMAAGLFSRPSREEFLRRKKEAKKAEKRKIMQKDKDARKGTGIRRAREASIFIAPKMIEGAIIGKEPLVELEVPRECYVCKELYNHLHHFYDSK